MIKRIFALFITFILLTSAVQITFADETNSKKTQRAELVLSEPDAEGYLTASLIIYDSMFLGCQFGFSFDNTVLQFVDKNTKEKSEDFKEVTTVYSLTDQKGTYEFTTLDKLSVISNTEGKLKIAVYWLPPASFGEGALVTVGEEGFKLCDFSMKLLKNEDPSFEVLDTNSTLFPKDVYIGDGRSYKATSFQFILPEELGEKEEVVYTPVLPEPSLEVKRERRLVDSLILNIGNYAAVDDGFLKWIDESNKNVVPFIEGDRTFIPLRFVGEAFGAKVDWTPENQEITIDLDETKIVMNIGKTTYTVNGEEKEMDVAPFIKEDRTIVPVRFVSEALGKAVYWDAARALVIVTPEDRPWDPDGEAEKSILPAALMIISDLVRDIKIEAAE